MLQRLHERDVSSVSTERQRAVEWIGHRWSEAALAPSQRTSQISVASIVEALAANATPFETLGDIKRKFQVSEAQYDRAIEMSDLVHIPLPLPLGRCRTPESFLKAIARCSEQQIRYVLGVISSQDCEGAPPRGQSIQELRLMNLNVWGTLSVGGLGTLLGFAARELERFDKLGEELRVSRANIVTLQEMWHPRALAMLSQTTFPFVARAASSPGMWQSAGLVTLSRWPIVQSEFTPFANRAGHERFVRKGVLRVRLNLGDSTNPRCLDVYNTHLVSPPEHVPLVRSSEFFSWLLGDAPHDVVRLNQIRELSQILKRSSIDQGVPYLLCGDLNADEGSVEYLAFCRRLGIDCLRALRTPEEESGITFDTAHNTWAKGLPGERARLDYMFMDRALASSTSVSVSVSHRDPTTRVSDHYAVESQVLLLPDWSKQ